MKLFKKIALLGMAMLTALSFGVLSACDDEGNSSSSSPDESSSSSSSSSSEPEEVTDFLYRIKVQNATGYAFKGVDVSLYDGTEEKATVTTNKDGYAVFTEDDLDELGTYSIQVEFPRGYALADPDINNVVVALKGYETSVEIAPTGVIQEKAPAGTTYELGDVVYDFTVITSDGETFTLSEVLAEKELVLLNFWATWCGPCKAEFPAMNNAYIQHSDKVEVLAISISDPMKGTAKKDGVIEFKAKNGLQFPMTSNSDCGADIVSMFPPASTSVPLSVMIDRYGAITYHHLGSMTEAKDFTARFEKFFGEDYRPTIIEGSGETSGDNNGGESGGSNLIKPTVSNPATAEIKRVLANGSDDFTFSWDEEDEYAWPWLIEDGELYSPVASQSLHGNYSILQATFTAGPGDAVFFDYLVSSETTDVLYFLVDGVPVQQFSGANNTLTWKENDGGYYFKEDYDEEGEHELIFIYRKDVDTSVDGECARIKNLRLVKSEDLDLEEMTLQVFRHAANIENTDENAKTLYKHYADVVYNEEDGYYHVNTTDGPILLANLMLTSRWSDTSVLVLAYNGYIVYEGYNFSADIEDHAWGASQPVPGFEALYGYAPVTKELKELLEFATKSEAINAENGYKKWDGKTHENEWLEICAYYDSYGLDPMQDHMDTITFHAAKEVYLGENTADILYNIKPRGFKYKFIPEESGVYNIYSTMPLNSYVDPVCFYFGNGTTDFKYYDELFHAPLGDVNFNFHVYMEAGKTYYFAMATYMDVAGQFTFNIDKLEGSYTYLANCATEESYNEATGEMFVYDGIEYGYSEADGYYHVKNKDGSLGSVIYVDMLRPTMIFQSDALYDIAKSAMLYYPDEENRAFYIDGEDYSDELAAYGHASHFEDWEGFVPLDQELFDILTAITTSEKYDHSKDSWQMLCYYEVTLGA